MKEEKGGGKLFTQTTIIKDMAEILAPIGGKNLDPACGEHVIITIGADNIDKLKSSKLYLKNIFENLRKYNIKQIEFTRLMGCIEKLHRL